MEPAVAGLAAALDEAQLGTPGFPVVANVDASAVTDGARARELLLKQLTSPVRWSQVVEALAAAHPGALFVEMGPGNVLVGLVKKIAPQLQSMACGTVADVDALLARLG
jgi:[acyl-carrier-protein] S-malonyltransferase